MNTTFNDLRKLARDKRDAAIKAIRDDYQTTLNEINHLQRNLTPLKPSLKGQPKPETPLRTEIMEVAPKHSTFTVKDILALLELPESEFARVRTTFDRLIKRGEMRLIKRGRSSIPAVFATSAYAPEGGTLNELSQIQAAEVVLREIGRPVDLTLLCVEMMQRGYEPVAGKAGFKKSLRSAMGRNTKFTKNSGQWSVAQAQCDSGFPASRS